MAHDRAPAWWPRRWYYGWAMVGTLGFTATVSYGVLSYGFAAFIAPMHAELGWSKTAITGAFSFAQLVAGIAAIPFGRWIDRHGTRGLMTAGSLLAATVLFLWSRVQSLGAFYLLWALMGVAMSAVLYEPAFAVIATWFRTRRSRPLTVLTFIGGFASVIFVPLIASLVSTHGWRASLVILAALYAMSTVIPHALLLRRRPEDLGILPPDVAVGTLTHGESTPVHAAAVVRPKKSNVAVRSSAFRRIAIAFALSAFTSTAITVHLIALLLERGYTIAVAGSAMGALGLMALPGRLIFTPLGERWSRSAVTSVIFALQAVALVCMIISHGDAAMWSFVVLFGAGFGAVTPARASLVADTFGAEGFGRVSGVLAFVVSLARAAAPVGASVVYDWGGGSQRGYDSVLTLLLFFSVASGLIVRSLDPAARLSVTRRSVAEGPAAR